jgi:spore coat polysaccharide biosynthesis protein SpsF
VNEKYMKGPKGGKIISTIECRMTSSRLPGKVLMEGINGKSMLEIMVERVKRVPQIQEVILATTVNKTDDPIESLAQKMGVGCFRGSEEDVLSRVLGAAKKFKADIIVELTGDCPLIDPEIISQVIDCYLRNDCDYASTGNPISYPAGMDTQVYPVAILERADVEGLTPEDREHVSWYIVHNPDKFRLLTIVAPPGLKDTNIFVTLDEKNDCELIRKILAKLYKKNKYFSCYDLVNLVKAESHLLKINEKVKRKSY